MACSSDVVYVATTRGYVLRYHWDDYGNEKGDSSRSSAQAARLGPSPRRTRGGAPQTDPGAAQQITRRGTVAPWCEPQ